MKRGDLARHLCQHLRWQLHPHDLRYQLLLWNYHPPPPLLQYLDSGTLLPLLRQDQEGGGQTGWQAARFGKASS